MHFRSKQTTSTSTSTRTRQLEAYVKPVKLMLRTAYRVHVAHDKTNQTGKWLRDELVSMGSTYIKVGQLIATRKDLFPDYITTELNALTDEVPASRIEDIYRVFYDDFQKPLHEMFPSFDEVPIGSASIAQVHVARLPNRKPVVVKIQRPHVREDMLHDIAVMNDILTVMETLIPIKQVKDVRAVILDTTKHLLQETDFVRESVHMRRFYAMFKHSPDIVVPRTYSKILSRNVLVMEYVAGTSFRDVEWTAAEGKQWARTLMTAFMDHLLRTGNIHADPHIGNMAFLPHSNQIVLYDFGTVAAYDVSLRHTFRQLLYDLLKQDIDTMIQRLLDVSIIEMYSGHSFTDLQPHEYLVLHQLITHLMQYVSHPDIRVLQDRIQQDPYIDASNLPFRFHSDMIILMKAFATLEGVCKEFDPTFSYIVLFPELIMHLFQNGIGFEFERWPERFAERLQSDPPLLMRQWMADSRAREAPGTASTKLQEYTRHVQQTQTTNANYRQLLQWAAVSVLIQLLL